MLRKWTAVLLGLGALAISTSTFASSVQWVGDRTVIVNRIFEVTKPENNWNSKEDIHGDTPIRWILHRGGQNPEIRVRLDYSPRGKTLGDYARNVASDLSVRGVRVDNTYDKSINNTEAVVMDGVDKSGKSRWLIAVFRAKGLGLIIESSSAANEFTKYSNDFLNTINSVRVNRYD